MALKSNFDVGRVQKETQVQAESLYQRILESFIRAGEKFIKNAREQSEGHAEGHYDDDTTNLRNSIGYFVFHNGENVFKNKGGRNTNVIGEAGQIESKVQEFINPKGFQLVGIAGMNYASHVESKGYNVISYQADVCMVDLAVYLETLEVIEQGTAARMEETFIP